MYIELLTFLFSVRLVNEFELNKLLQFNNESLERIRSASKFQTFFFV
jgi:hypothetical protein